jgi:wobble nucleotide-excising tRNase
MKPMVARRAMRCHNDRRYSANTVARDMLRKIISVNNVGKFRKSAAGGDTTFANRTLIVGANGFGKTTLCAVLRSLKTGEPSHVIGRKTLGTADGLSVEILSDSGTSRFDGTAWSSTYPTLEIFDGVFVAENVHSGEVVDIEHKRNFYRVIIGEKGVALANQDADLAAKSREKTGEITAAQRALQPHIPRGMTLEAFVALPSEADIARLIAEQERTVQAVREAAIIKGRGQLTEFPVPQLPDALIDLLARSLEDIAKDAQRLVEDHLSTHGMPPDGGSWIAKGIEYLAADNCPFCGQDIKGLPLIVAYRAIFSGKYKALVEDIAVKLRALDKSFGEVALAKLDTLAEQNKGAVEFWRQYCSFGAAPLTYADDIAARMRTLGHAARALLERKQHAPLEVIAPDPSFISALRNYESAKSQLETLNQSIRAVNAAIAAKKTETGSADPKAAESQLTHLKAVKTRHNPDIAPLCSAHGRCLAEKEDIDRRKTAVRKQLDGHTKSVVKSYERRINELLDVFNAGFTIAETAHSYPGGIATSSYQLVINQTAIDIGDGKTPPSQPSFKNTLSAGDRTTLALAFFIADLERDPTLATKTIVFDDPFNSQDTFRRRQTVHEIVKLAARGAQVIVLSHDATFLKQIWDKSASGERKALLIADHRAQGSKLLPADLEKATQGRTATDMDDLQTFLTTGAGNVLDIVRKMRVVLETYLRTTYQSSFAAEDWLGDMVRKIREGGAAHPAQALYEELDQLNDYTAQYHHGEDVADATPDQIDPTELTGYAKRTLKIVNALQA